MGTLLGLVVALGGCGDDEGNGGGGTGGVGASAGSGGTSSTGGQGTGGTGALGGGGGGVAGGCTLGDQFCVSHDSRRFCAAGPNGNEFSEETCADGSGCVQGECVVGACSDECRLGDSSSGQTCELYDMGSDSWVSPDATGSLHDRAREYTMWLRRDGMAFGGVGNARYSDPPTYSNIVSLGGVGDSAIWTGTYLASEALRLQATGAADARANVIDAVETLHLWFNVAGDPGLLSRFAKPSDQSTSFVIGDIDCAISQVFCGVDYQGTAYDYNGHISRDQYQGVMLGYSLAYEALSADDEATRALIRDDVVEFVEELMLDRTVPIRVTINGTTLPQFSAQMRFVVLASREMDNGAVQLILDTNNTDDADMLGFQEFMPNLGDLVSQIPGFGWLSYVPRSDSGVMLSSFFRVAMQVTEGVEGFESQHAAFVDYYLNHALPGGNVSHWLEIAKTNNPDEQCGDGYYANNIIMEPMYNLARLETDAGRLATIRNDVLGGWLWAKLHSTKNTFFSFIYAGNVPGHDPNVVTSAVDQLGGFPLPPRVKVARDLVGEVDGEGVSYSAAPYTPHVTGCSVLHCNHSTAVDVQHRAWGDFMWQRQPWSLSDSADPGLTAPGVDFLVAYWMGRHHGFIDDDTPARCLAWH
ncbi:MAG: hypothetical protein JRI23_36715 [Deltaproteobacteria bacterium]|nr:hypothetical protein [Deltaproteobacteria bacterium]MBW2537913.1 hypothetical protein [Deltaproteobacteria bacterium]